MPDSSRARGEHGRQVRFRPAVRRPEGLRRGEIALEIEVGRRLVGEVLGVPGLLGWLGRAIEEAGVAAFGGQLRRWRRRRVEVEVEVEHAGLRAGLQAGPGSHKSDTRRH